MTADTSCPTSQLLPALSLALALLLSACAAPGPTEPAGALPPVRTGFTPTADTVSAEDLVLQTIAQARHSILVAAYAFNSWRVAQALIEARGRHCDVRLLIDANAADIRPRTALRLMLDAGIPVRVSRQYSSMHHKFMVLDGRHLQTGSFNYTHAAATKNAENVLLLREMPELAATYAREWQRLWDESEPLAP